jgi:uncharacterized protein (DUF433 family)
MPMADISPENAHAAVVMDEASLGGEPVFKGTRVSVRLIASMLADGVAEAEILSGDPALERRQLRLARLWAAAHPHVNRPNTLRDRGHVPTSTKRIPLGSKA